MRKRVGKIIAIIVVVLLGFIALATIDSCNRHNKNCFGVTGTK